MLSGAYLDTYDAAVQIAGDRDYVPLVEGVKRLGKIVCVASFVGTGGGLSPALRLSADVLFDLGQLLKLNWDAFAKKEATASR